MAYDSKGTIALFLALEAYHNPNCLVNIVSLDLLQMKYHTCFDSAEQNAFTVKILDGQHITFEGFGSGLYFFNLNSAVVAYPSIFLNTVSKNFTALQLVQRKCYYLKDGHLI